MKRDRAKEIMDVAERLFTSRRFHEITLDHVAREAGVGKGTIYRYFKDKDDLFFQVALSGFDALCDLLRAEAPASMGFREQLHVTCRQIGSFYAGRRQLFHMMQTEDARMFWRRGRLREAWLEHRQRLLKAVAEVLGRGRDRGSISPAMPLEALAALLLGMMRTRARELACPNGSVPSIEAVVDLFLDGATPRLPASIEEGSAV